MNKFIPFSSDEIFKFINPKNNDILSDFNSSYLEELIYNIENSYKFTWKYWIDDIYLYEALELSDLIFNNNFDKIYFLRQYLKSFETNRKYNIKTKNFVRKKHRF